MEPRHNDLPLKEVLKLFVEKYRLKARLHQTRLDELWGKLMGPTIAGYTREIKMRGKKLYLTVDSAPLRQELNMGREKLRDRLNEALGEEYIQEVIIR
jgi:predicted nucleic acid-binding Zn ribbon protein